MKNYWKLVKIGDIGEVVGGGTPSTKCSDYYGGDIPWITPKDLSNFRNRYISRGERMISKLGLENSSARMLPPFSVLFTSRAPIGYIAIAKNELCTNQGFKSIIPDPKKCDALFLYYLLKYKKNDIELIANGSTFQEVSGTALKNFEVSIPPLDEQRKIAGVLSALDDKIELNNKINRNLEAQAQAQAIFKSWFIDFEPFKNGKFIDSELGKIPEGWVCKKLKDFVEIKRGSSPRPIQDYLSGSGYNWLKISDATSESSPFIFNIKEHIKKSGISQTVYLVAGELVLSNSATPGIPKFLDVNTCIHDGWLWFSNSKLSYEFLYLFFLHKRRDFISLGNGSVFTNLKTDIVKDALFVYPNKAVMDEFDKITKTIFENIKIRSRESQRLTQLRDALLPKLMSGEIDVTDIAV